MAEKARPYLEILCSLSYSLKNKIRIEIRLTLVGLEIG